MWQISGFSLEVCVKLYYTEHAYPLNPKKKIRILVINNVKQLNILVITEYL
jgi:hypothetical protein